jgi:hypothetical protein
MYLVRDPRILMYTGPSGLDFSGMVFGIVKEIRLTSFQVSRIIGVSIEKK